MDWKAGVRCVGVGRKMLFVPLLRFICNDGNLEEFTSIIGATLSIKIV